jgi:hypothetical protein
MGDGAAAAGEAGAQRPQQSLSRADAGAGSGDWMLPRMDGSLPRTSSAIWRQQTAPSRWEPSLLGQTKYKIRLDLYKTNSE